MTGSSGVGQSWPSSVDICICTFRRPDLLGQTLRSIESSNAAGDLPLTVIVVDNDHAESARASVEAFHAQSRFQVIYKVEPRQNIALARNSCVALSSAPVVAFVDDDETVSKNWLLSLVSCMVAEDADAVFGPVLPVYPTGTPKWIRSVGLVDRPRRSTGDRVPTGATNNALVRRVLLERFQGPFDPTFGLTGGEDSALFQKAAREGFKLVWCDDAPVSEAVSRDRVNLRYLLRRAYRSGQGWARIHLAHAGLGATLVWFVKRVVYVVASSCLVVLSVPLGVRPLIWSTRKLFLNIGQLSVLGAARLEDYRG